MTHSTKLRTSTVSSVEPVILSKIERMIIKKPPGLFVLILAFVLPTVLGFVNGHAQTIEVSSDQMPAKWDIFDKIREKDDELAKISVSIGRKEIIYYENRVSILTHDTKSGCEKKKGVWDEEHKICKSIIRKKLSDKERGIGLKLLNTVTGEIEIIKVNTKITASGVEIISPSGYQIEIVEEPNGVKWNLWYTFYRVISPENTAVIKNNFPRETAITVSRVVKGKVKEESKKTVQGFLYVPYSEFFEQPEQEKVLVKAGIDHDKNDVSQAFALLRERGVQSRAFPEKLIADVEELSPRFFERLPLLEQGDFTKFRLDPEKTIKRTLIRLGTNGENAWKYTCNRTNACGWVQFTPGTYSNMRKFYPMALLEKDFKTGAGDHVNSIMAAILLHDYNLGGFLKKGNKKLNGLILKDSILMEELLDSGYNGHPKWAYNSLNATVSKGLPDWVTALSPTRKDLQGGLRRETRDFMFKLRYLVANDLP